MKPTNIAILPVSVLQLLQVVKALPLSLNTIIFIASVLSNSIPLIINQRSIVFIHLSKYCKCLHFLSKLFKLFCDLTSIPLNSLKNLFCASWMDILVVNSQYTSDRNLSCCPC